MLTIRPTTTEDYAAIAAVASATFPEDPTSPEELAYADETRPNFIRHGRWAAVYDGQVVGYTYHTQYADLYDPRRLWVTVVVHPDWRRRGFGQALYNHLMQQVGAIEDIEAIQGMVREQQEGGLAFAARHGFTQASIRWPSRLDVAACDLSPYKPLLEKLAAEDIRIVPLADLMKDPDCAQKLYQLQSALDADVPIDEPVTPIIFEQFRANIFDNPFLLHEGTFIALHNGEYIGMSSLFDEGNDLLVVDLTGTLAAYRQRGIAMALKVRGVQFAKARGSKAILTTNDPVNAGMLAINNRLGFVRQPALIKFVKVLSPAAG